MKVVSHFTAKQKSKILPTVSLNIKNTVFVTSLKILLLFFTILCYFIIIFTCVCLDEEAKSELRKLIRQHLSDELKKLRLSVDEQIKASEDAITKKLQSADGKDGAPASGKAKRK